MILSSLRRQQGLTLAELMIAMGLGLFVVAGAMMMFISSKQTYQASKSLSLTQEAGRYAMALLIKDIQSSGYRGMCIDIPKNHIHANERQPIWSGDTPIQGWTNSKPAFIGATTATNSDTIFIQFAGNGLLFSGDPSNNKDNNEVKLGSGEFTPVLASNLLLSDGIGCDFFAPTSNGESIKKDNALPWTHDYISEFELLTMQLVAYYVANDNGTPTLYKAYFDDDLDLLHAEAMVPGVEAIQFSYDTGAGNYVTASSVSNWQNIRAVRVLISTTDSKEQQKDFSSTVYIRNNRG